MASVVGDASWEVRYEDLDLHSFVNSGDGVDVGSQSADRGSMESAMEVVTAKRACSQAKRRNLHLQGLVYEASEALDRVAQCSWQSNMEVDEQKYVKYKEERNVPASRQFHGKWRLRD